MTPTSSLPIFPAIFRDRIVLLCCVPFLFIAAMIAVFGVDVLYWDEWMIWIKLLPHVQEGTLKLSHLVAQQNEQRNAAARVFGLLLLPLFKLNRFAEFYLILGLYAVTFASLVRLYERTRAFYEIQGQKWVVVCFAFLIFSWTQWQVFTFGVNTSIALPITCLCLSMALLADRRLPVWKFLSLGVIGYVGSFNFANGLFNWFCLIPSLLTVQTRPGRKKYILLLWLGLAASAWALYFYQYTKPPHHPSLAFVFEHPLITVGFLLTYLGASFVVHDFPFPAALAFGLGGCALLVYNLQRLRRTPVERLIGLAPWLALLFFACLTAVSTCVGRAGFGIQQQALQSRYIAFSSLFWVSLAVLTVCADRLSTPCGPHARRFRMGFFFACCAGYLITTGLDVIVVKHRAEKFVPGRTELFRLVDDETLKYLFPDPHYLKSELHRFFQARVSIYRGFKELGGYRLAAVAGCGALESVRVIPGAGDVASGLLLTGWAKDPTKDRPAAFVLIVNKGKLIYAAAVGDDRQALAQSTGLPWLRFAGFTLFLPSTFFPEHDACIEAYSLSADGVTIAKLDSPANVSNAPVAVPAPYFPPFIIQKHFFSQ